MKKRRILSTLLTAAMIATTFAGCSSNSGGTTTNAGNSGSPADNGGASGGVQEITWMFWDDLDATEDLISLGYKDTIERFNKDYEGKYHVKPITTNLEEYYNKLNALVAANETPDVFIVSPGPQLTDYVEPGVAAPLDDYLNKDGWKDTFTSDAVFSQQTYDGKIYAVPLNTAAACCFYNTEMFEKAGAKVPTNWDEMLDACEKLEKSGVTPVTISAGTAWCLSMVAGYLCDRNGLSLSDIKEHKTDWKDAKVINAAKQIQELSQYFQPTAESDDNDIATAAFYDGEAAILIQGSWAIGQINGSCEPGFEQKVGVFAFPAVDGSSADPNRVIAKSDSIAMSATSKNPEAAVALMKYFVDDTAQKYTAEKGGKIPVTTVKYDESIAPPELSYVMDVFKSASATFGFYNESLVDSEAGSTFDSCFVEIFKGADPEEALNPIQEYYESNVWK